MEKFRYHEMLPHEIVARRAKYPVAFIGLGTLEWHGEHLAVGNDALKAEKLCEMAAQRSGGFAFPTLWYGDPRITWLMESDHDSDGAIHATMGFRSEKFTEAYWQEEKQRQLDRYAELIYHMLMQMNQLEMRAVCMVCGHYPLQMGAAPAIEKFNKNCGETQAFAAIEPGYVAQPTSGGPSWQNREAGGDHAAKWETSYLWYLRPDCVDMSVFLGREEEPLIGVRGDDPRKTASIEIGRKGCNLIVDGMIRKADELLARSGAF